MAEELIGTLQNLSVKNHHINAAAAIERSKMAQRGLAEDPINLMDLRVWDAVATNLPGTAASDDLGLITGTFATAPVTVQTSDAKTTTVTQRARFILPIPLDYDDGQDFKIRANAGMMTTVANGTATIDFEAYVIDKLGSITGAPTDRVTTAATTINSLTAAAKDFIVDGSAINPSDVLDVRVTIAITDSGTGTAVIGRINNLAIIYDVL